MAEDQLEKLSDLGQKHEMKESLVACFKDSPPYEASFYQHLSHDGCYGRHNILEPQTLEKFCPLDNGRHEDGASQVQSTGLFALLPHELLIAIFVDELDLATLTTLRSVSRDIRDMVSSFPQYNTIVTHAPASMRASLSLDTAQRTSCRVLYETLCSPRCSCGAFGAYLYLPAYQRVCYHCFTTAMEYMPMTPEMARIKFALTSRNLANVIQIRTVAGNYTPQDGFRNIDRKRIRLLDMWEVGQVALAVHGAPEKVCATNREAYNDRIRQWAERTQEWGQTPRNYRTLDEPGLPLYMPTFESEKSSSHRRMLVVGFPWYDRGTGTVDWGVACKGCNLKRELSQDVNGKKGPRLDRVLYSKSSFLDHFWDCLEARKLYLESRQLIAGHEKIRQGRYPHCRVVGNAESSRATSMTEDGVSPSASCFLWYGLEPHEKSCSLSVEDADPSSSPSS